MTFLTAALTLGMPPQGGSLTLSPPKIVYGLRPVAFAAAPSGSRFAVAMEDGSVRIMDAATEQTTRQLAKHLQPAYALAWSRDGAYIASGDETARVWVEDARTGAKLHEYRTHTKGIQKVSFNTVRDRIMTTGKDDFIKVYDITSPKTKEVVSIAGNGANFYGAAFSTTLPYTLTTGILGSGARIYDAKSGKVVGFLTGHGGQGVFDVAYNPSGNRLVTAGRDANAILWDLPTMKPVGTMKGHQDWVVYTAFSPNGKYIATSSTDRTVKLWNAYSLQKVAELQNQNTVGSPLAFTSDGKYLLTVNDAGFLQVNGLSPAQAATVAPATRTAPRSRRTHRRRR